jgi:hypothetical protein
MRIDYRSVFPAAREAMASLDNAVQASSLESELLELVKLRASQLNARVVRGVDPACWLRRSRRSLRRGEQPVQPRRDRGASPCRRCHQRLEPLRPRAAFPRPAATCATMEERDRSSAIEKTLNFQTVLDDAASWCQSGNGRAVVKPRRMVVGRS